MNKEIEAILLGVVLGFGLACLIGMWIVPPYEQGYRAAWEDMKAGKIECVVSVNHPEWLKEEGGTK